MSDCTVMVFCKYPEPGRVKTRLGVETSNKVAAELYKAFTADTLAAVLRVGLSVEVHYAPGWEESRYRQWLGAQTHLIPQNGEDLGQRMATAFSNLFGNGRRTGIIIGSDLPELTPQLLEQARQTVETDGAAIAPSGDGGYSLLAFRNDSFTPDIFREVDWSTDRVFGQTMTRFRHAGLTPRQLPELPDIDTYEDLMKLVSGREVPMHTKYALKALGLWDLLAKTRRATPWSIENRTGK